MGRQYRPAVLKHTAPKDPGVLFTWLVQQERATSMENRSGSGTEEVPRGFFGAVPRPLPSGTPHQR